MDKRQVRDKALTPTKWPRVRDLPQAERVPFTRWLAGQTRPMIDGLPMAEQDAYYQGDYENWKSGGRVWD